MNSVCSIEQLTHPSLMEEGSFSTFPRANIDSLHQIIKSYSVTTDSRKNTTLREIMAGEVVEGWEGGGQYARRDMISRKINSI